MRQLRSSPKLQVFNTALMTAQSGYTFKEAKADREYWGHLVESAVGACLVNAAAAGDCEVFYCRERGVEVDFVVRHEWSGSLWAQALDPQEDRESRHRQIQRRAADPSRA